MSSLAETGSGHEDVAELLGGVAAELRADGRFAQKQIAQPHPLLVLVRDSERIVLIAPSIAWDNGRDIFKPFAGQFGEARAALILLGHPSGRGIDEAVNRGLVATCRSLPSGDGTASGRGGVKRSARRASVRLTTISRPATAVAAGITQRGHLRASSSAALRENIW